MEEKQLKVLISSNSRELLKQFNSLNISKEDVVQIVVKDSEFYLFYLN